MKFLPLIAMLFFLGCTQKLWTPPSYDEKLLGFYADKNSNQVVVEGEKYSYVFKASDRFIKALKASRCIDFFVRYRNFKIDKNNNITGVLKLRAVSRENQEKLAKMGFLKDEMGHIAFDFYLEGTRYKVEGDIPFEKLQDVHEVGVETPTHLVNQTGKIVVTPAALIIDGIGAIAFTSFYGVVLATD